MNRKPRDLDEALRTWARRFLLRVALALLAALAVLQYALRDRHPLWIVALAGLALLAWVGARLTARSGCVFIASPRTAVLPVLQKANHGATDTVGDGLLVHSGRWTRPPVHVRSTGDGVLLTSTRAHARRLRRRL